MGLGYPIPSLLASAIAAALPARLPIGDDGGPANANPVAAPLALGDLTVGAGLVQSSAQLLAGATDADGDTLTVTSVTAVSGGTVSGTGPWTITPTAEGAGSATVVISDGQGGSVSRTVTWNGVSSSGLSGGTAALGWSASTLNAGAEITISTDGTHNFGAAPTQIAQVGFGSGWLYTQPLLTVTTQGTDLGGIVASEGGARRIEEIDGIRTLAARLRDAAGWDGMRYGAHLLTYDLGAPMADNSRIAVFQTVRVDYPGEALAWQYKSVRLHHTVDMDQITQNEMLFHGSRTHTQSAVLYDANENLLNRAEILHPHANLGWQTWGLMLDTGTAATEDAIYKSRICRNGSGLPVTEKTDVGFLFDPASAMRPAVVAMQDYWDNSNGTPYEPTNLDQYNTDIQMQRDSFGVVYLADAPTPEQATKQVLQPTVSWAANQIKVKRWEGIGVGAVQYLHVYDGDGDFVGGTPVVGEYVPPAWNPYTDTIGLQRPTGNPSSDKRISVAGVGTGSEVIWSAHVSPDSIASNLGIFGGSTIRGLIFGADGSISLRVNGMGAMTVIRPAGEHLLEVGTRYLVEMIVTATLVTIRLNGITVASHIGSGMSHGIDRVMEISIPSGFGFIGKIYSAAVSIDGVPTHEWRFSEGAGTSGADSIGAITAVIGASFTWVSG